MCPVVMSTTYGEREGKLSLAAAWEILGGLPCSGICGYIENTVTLEMNGQYGQIIEKKAENMYRTINQKIASFPASNKVMRQKVTIPKAINLTPQETEQLSEYVSDDTFVQRQKEDIQELTSMFRDMLDNSGTDNEQEYLDDGTLDAVGMARSLRTYKGKTSTSCPNVADWLAAYEGAEQIFVATITGTLSGSYNAALLAAEEYKETHPEARVFVLDSLSAGPELRLLAERLRDLVRIGMEFDEICEAILAYHKHTHLLFSLESLANLARNGRVKPAVAAVARMLGIRVIGQASESGELEVLCKTRGEHGALERIVLELKDHGFTDGKVHIAHCDNPEAAKRLKLMIHAVFAGAQVDVAECGGLCSYYAEQGGLMVGYEDGKTE